MTAPSAAEATAGVAEIAAVAGAGHLLEDAALSALLGRAVRIQHVRVKPGRSVHVAWRSEDVPHRQRWGWAEATNDPDKADKARLRAELAGEPVEVLRNGEATLLWGGVATDRAIAKELLGARTALGEDLVWEVLRYNPGKRVVAKVRPDTGPAVLRVSSGTDELVTASQWFADLGTPTLVPVNIGGRGTASLTPWWGGSDLHAAPDGAAALEAGRAIGLLHHRSQGRTWPGEAPQGPALEATASGLLEVAPWLGNRLQALVERLHRLSDELAETEPVWLHGDLSPDQVLHDGAGDVRVIDLDRAGPGPAALDVGSWLAACRAMDLPELAEPFLVGHAEQGSISPRAVAIAECLAQFRAAIDPFRKLWPNWPTAVTDRVALAEQALRSVS